MHFSRLQVDWGLTDFPSIKRKMKYVLRAFSQVLPDEAVNVDVQFVQDNPKVVASIACPPIVMTQPNWTNEDLLKAVSEAVGQKVELPVVEVAVETPTGV